MDSKDLEDKNEEFDNFMLRVNEVNNIVKKLSSDDKNLREIGVIEADKYLQTEKSTMYENIDEDTAKLTFTSDRTIINQNALRSSNSDQGTMGPDAFMAEVSRDADQRYQDRQLRQQRSNSWRNQATKAFRRGEFEKSVTLFTKAIEQIKDHAMLYNDRALAYINLGFLEKALADVKQGLQLHDGSLKGGLLLAKIFFLRNEVEEFEEAVEEVKKKNKNHISFIDEYVENLEKNKIEEEQH